MGCNLFLALASTSRAVTWQVHCKPPSLGESFRLVCTHRQGCYGPDDIAVLTPYLGQLMLLRKHLENHTVVQLEEADAKLLEDLAESKQPPSLPDSATQEQDPPMKPAEAVANIKSSTLRSQLRLATVDNFQGRNSHCCIKFYSLSSRMCNAI